MAQNDTTLRMSNYDNYSVKSANKQKKKSQSAKKKKLKENKTGQALSAALMYLPSAIAAVFIANAYDPKVSTCGQSEYTIDLRSFCLIGGYAQIGYTCVMFLVQCFQ